MHAMTDYTEGPVIGPFSLLYECYVIVTLTHYSSLYKNTFPCTVKQVIESDDRLNLPDMTSSVGVDDASLLSN